MFGYTSRPTSLRLIATFLCLLALLVMEALGLVHIFILGKTGRHFWVSQEGHVVRNGSLVSDYAPVVHYGATESICQQSPNLS